jgi:hypothetical protein
VCRTKESRGASRVETEEEEEEEGTKVRILLQGLAILSPSPQVHECNVRFHHVTCEQRCLIQTETQQLEIGPNNLPPFIFLSFLCLVKMDSMVWRNRLPMDLIGYTSSFLNVLYEPWIRLFRQWEKTNQVRVKWSQGYDGIISNFTVNGVLHSLYNQPARSYWAGDEEGNEFGECHEWFRWGEMYLLFEMDFGVSSFTHFVSGRKHRELGPAHYASDGVEVWYHHGQRHRLGGPAVTKRDGTQEWWKHGKKDIQPIWE